jgi:hypothetical protein
MRFLLLLLFISGCATMNKVNGCKLREKETSRLDGGK